MANSTREAKCRELLVAREKQGGLVQWEQKYRLVTEAGHWSALEDTHTGREMKRKAAMVSLFNSVQECVSNRDLLA